MILSELANQINQVRRSRIKVKRRTRAKNMAVGASVGTLIGAAAGILFAPKTGKETRQLIADRTSETMKNLKDNVDAVKAKVSESVVEKGSRMREAGQKGAKAAKETLKKSNEEKKKKSKE